MAKSLKDFLMKKYEKTGAVNMLEEIEFLDTGIPSLNYVLSGRPLTGGIPLSGKMTMIYGPEGAGKTSLINHIIGISQKKGIDVVYIDTERSITKPRLRQFGVNIDNMTYATPEYIEEVFSVIEDVCSYRLAEKDGVKTLIVWDSIAGTPAKQTLDRDSDSIEMAADSRALTRGLKRVRGKVKNSNVGVIFVNQARANLDMYGDQFVLPGGFALKHMVDLVVRVNKLKVGKRTDGQVIKISTPDKNRLFRPFQSTEIFFDFEKCFSRDNIIAAFVDFLANIGMLGKSGSWCYSLDEVQQIMAEKGVSEEEATKSAHKFYRTDYTEKLIADDAEYQSLLNRTESYIQKNLRTVAERGKDKDLEDQAERNKKSGMNVSADYEGQEKELADIISEDSQDYDA